MQGETLKAAKWLGGCLVLSSLILVIGFHPTVTGRVVSFTKVQPEVTPPQYPTIPVTSYYIPPGAPGLLPPAANATHEAPATQEIPRSQN